jgi:ribosomal-protein-alanine N-acetyltransferase
MSIFSKRLALRPWEDRDRQPFADMSADADVMRYLTPMPTRDLSDAWIDRQIARCGEDGFCFWAVETLKDRIFVGSVGLVRTGYAAHFTPAVEVGWRIARPFWGLGYAPEAAEAALRFGFETLRLTEIVANAAVGNDKSRRVMAKLGMSYDPADDFDHPRVANDDPVRRRQVLYRLTRETWLSSRGT